MSSLCNRAGGPDPRSVLQRVFTALVQLAFSPFTLALASLKLRPLPPPSPVPCPKNNFFFSHFILFHDYLCWFSWWKWLSLLKCVQLDTWNHHKGDFKVSWCFFLVFLPSWKLKKAEGDIAGRRTTQFCCLADPFPPDRAQSRRWIV